ncbi:MAG: hypothetical protein QM658_18330, partial [Gordonia sp. (in: high G+C Gram-positive bacteria)]
MPTSDNDKNSAVDKVVGAFRARREGGGDASESTSVDSESATQIIKLDGNDDAPAAGGSSETPTKVLRVPPSDDSEETLSDAEPAPDEDAAASEGQDAVVEDAVGLTDEAGAADLDVDGEPAEEDAELAVAEAVETEAASDDAAGADEVANQDAETEVVAIRVPDDAEPAADDSTEGTVDSTADVTPTEKIQVPPQAADAPTQKIQVPKAAAAAAAAAAVGAGAAA